MNFVNIIGTLTATVAVLNAVFVQIGKCAVDPVTQLATCSASWIPQSMAGYVVAFFGIILIISKMIRPGGPLRGLFGGTAVIVPDEEAKPGVVTKEQVNAPK